MLEVETIKEVKVAKRVRKPKKKQGLKVSRVMVKQCMEEIALLLDMKIGTKKGQLHLDYDVKKGGYLLVEIGLRASYIYLFGNKRYRPDGLYFALTTAITALKIMEKKRPLASIAPEAKPIN